MVFAAISNEVLSLLLLAICVLPIAVLIVFAFVKMIIRIKNTSVKKENDINQEQDLSQKEVFVNAFGGSDNITSVTKEMNRVIVDVEDIELVNAEELKNLGATGVLLVGKTVKCGFGDRAQNVYDLLK